MSETTCKNCERIGRTCPACIAERIKPATPPTPDLDAVVARVQRIAANLHDIADSDGVHHSGWGWQVHRAAASLEIEAQSLLAAVARPAEARGDICNHGRENILECKVCVPSTTRERDLLTALYFAQTTGDKVLLLREYATHPAPSGGEAWCDCARGTCKGGPTRQCVMQYAKAYAAPRPDPGEPVDIEELVDEATEEADDTLPKGYKRFGKVWLHSFTRAILAAQRGTA